MEPNPKNPNHQRTRPHRTTHPSTLPHHHNRLRQHLRPHRPLPNRRQPTKNKTNPPNHNKTP
jgi:hypothetical protein